MDLAQKQKILELLENKETVVSIAKRFVVNESTIRSIRQSKLKIINSFSKLGPHAKFSKISRSGNILYCLMHSILKIFLLYIIIFYK